jgi:hypothetical protein
MELFFMGTAHDADTIHLLRRVLEEAWDALQPHHRDQTSKSQVAACVLRQAANGERHPGQLLSWAIADAVQDIAAASSRQKRFHDASIQD